VETHEPLPWDTRPGKEVDASARKPDRTEMRERERKREREKEGTWRGNTRTPAVGHHPRQGRGYQRTHPRKDRDEREREYEPQETYQNNTHHTSNNITPK
jgi:hypothetical protein